MNRNDSFKHRGLRKQLIDQIRKNNVASEKVLDVMLKIPRHIFMDDIFVEHSYQDKAFPIAQGQTISQPTTVAYQTTLLNLTENDIVLEIGTGSGYQALILAEMAGYVLSIERQRALYLQAKKTLPQFKHKNLQLFYGDGYKGLPDYAPFDKIIVTCGATKVPEQLIHQLKKNGRMVIPVGGKNVQTMLIIDKDEKGNIHKKEGKDFRFVPMLRGKDRSVK